MKPPEFLIEIRNTNVYLKGMQILSDIDWTMLADENWAVVGNNGSGKTTLLRLLFGEIIPRHGGTVHRFGQRQLRPLGETRNRIGYVSSDFQGNYKPAVTGLEVVVSGFFSSVGLYAKPSLLQRKKAMEWIEKLDIKPLTVKPIGQMSYGEARQVLLARALVNNPEILILDEPCSGLDIPAKERFLKSVESLAQKHTRLIYVTHHVEEILPSITHILFMKSGTIWKQGAKHILMNDEILSSALEIPINLILDSGRYRILRAGGTTKY